MIKRSFITHVLVNACFSKRPFYASYLTYVIRCRTLNMHYPIYMFTLRLPYLKYAFWKRSFNTCCTFFNVVKIMLPYDMVPQCKKLMHRILVFRRIWRVNVDYTTSYHMKRKRKRSDSVLWQKPLHQQNRQKGKVTTQTTPQKKFDYTAFAETHMKCLCRAFSNIQRYM